MKERVLIAVFVTAAVFWPATGDAQEHGDSPAIHSGAVELGIGGVMTTVEGISNGNITVRTGLFEEALGGLVAGEAAMAYRHQSSLDGFDLEGWFSWQRQWGATGNYPFVAVGGGLSYEGIGSFDVTRYPLALALGVRILFGNRAAIRAEYQIRRMLNDPVADFSESRLLIGISMFLRNV